MPNEEETLLFKQNLDRLVEAAVARFRENPDLASLKGDNPWLILEKAQLYFGLTLWAAYRFKDPAIHRKLLPWVYRSYWRHGFAPDYFAATLQIWIDISSRLLPLSEIYTALMHDLLDLDAEMRAQSREVPDSYITPGPEQELFLALIEQDEAKIGGLLGQLADELGLALYSRVLQPIMYEVGRYWEMDKISVDQEHEISARISSFLAAKEVPIPEKPGHSILITPAPNEFHELGALMLANYFRAAGWQVHYLNAGTSRTELSAALVRHRPAVLAISVALVLHAPYLPDYISSARETAPGIKIIVGGRFINQHPELVPQLGVDGYAETCEKALALAEKLVGE